jgi:predicted nucleotidyltransferase
MTKSKLQQLLAEVKSDLEKLYGDQLVAVILYGSYARGEAGANSDVDIVMVLKDYERDFIEIDRTNELVSRLSLDYDVIVALIPLREKNWREEESSFLQNLRRDSVIVK